MASALPTAPAKVRPDLLSSLSGLFKRLTTIAPKEAKATVGLDIGSSAIKVLVLGARRAGGARPVIGQNLVPLEPGQEVDAADAIKAAVKTLQLPTKNVTFSVSGQWVIMRIVEMPTMKPAEMKQALPFEAQRYLPFNAQDVIIDGVALGPSDASKTWVLVVACKKELIERRLDWIKRAGLEATLIDVDALALANSFLSSPQGRKPDGTFALINVGAQLSNLVILKQQIPYLVRDIPWGADKLIRGAAEQLNVEEAAIVQQLTQGSASPELLGALQLLCEALVGELQLSFDYFENRFGHPPDELLLSGGLGQSAVFAEALKTHVTQPVVAWAPLKGLSGQFAVAYGLALRSD